MIKLTEQASKKVTQQLSKRGKGLGILIGVRTTGCSGLAYKLEYVDNVPVSENCISYTQNNITIWIDKKDLPYLAGLTMDYKRQGLNEGFEFINPNERDRCGCGESFRV